MKKILIINDLLQGGGVEKLMLDIVNYFHNKYEITVMTKENNNDHKKVLPDNVHYMSFGALNNEYSGNVFAMTVGRIKHRLQINEIKKAINNQKFDVLLCMKEGWTMNDALIFAGDIPYKIAWVHTDYSKSYYTGDIYKTAEAEIAIMKNYNKIICVSKVIEESIKTVIGNPGNLTVTYNPVDKDDIVSKAKEPVEDIFRSERPLFVSVGRLNIQKGYDVLMEVCNLLNSDGYEYDVWIIGGGEKCNNYQFLHSLEDQIRRYHLDNVYLLGAKKNPHKYVRQADWFLSTSRYEGYSYVSQEAAIVGKPLMLTECSGVMELLGLESNGIVMENSFKGIYYGMKKVIENPELSKEYSNRIKIKTHKEYWDDQMQKIEKLFMSEE